MYAPDINRSILRMHIASIEAKHPIKMLGLPPRGSAAHVLPESALDFLAEKRPGLDSTCSWLRASFGVGSPLTSGLDESIACVERSDA